MVADGRLSVQPWCGCRRSSRGASSSFLVRRSAHSEIMSIRDAADRYTCAAQAATTGSESSSRRSSRPLVRRLVMLSRSATLP